MALDHCGNRTRVHRAFGVDAVNDPIARDIIVRELETTERFARKCDDTAARLEIGDPAIKRWLNLSVDSWLLSDRLRDTLNGRGPWASA